MQLWIDSHKPTKLEDFIGNKKAVEELKDFVLNFKQGEALMFYGPTGIGKSLLVEAFCLENNCLLTQVNSSDISIENIQEIKASSKNKSIFHKNKIILIDELDGISGTKDRGVTTEIIELIKASKFPIILITSDPYIQKLRAIKEYSKLIKFDKIPSPSIAKRLADICSQEKIEADKETLAILSKFCQGDLRSAISDLQTVCLGKNKVGIRDLEPLGFREREESIFNTLQPIFHSRSLNAGKAALNKSDKDPDEIFWWIENNLLQELKTPEEISEGYNLLSCADILRGRAMKQQNWRFKAIASDLISGISILKKSHTGFIMYRPSLRLVQLGKAKSRREEAGEILSDLGGLHCSKKKFFSEYASYMEFFKLNKPEYENGPAKNIKERVSIKKEAKSNGIETKKETGDVTVLKAKRPVEQPKNILKTKTLFSF